jgi:P27 family predicted phage terminase small subunit
MGSRGRIPKDAFGPDGKTAKGKGVGPPPFHLSKQAKGHYENLADMLKDRLDPEDETVLAVTAQAMWEIQMANMSLVEEEDFTVMGSQGPSIAPIVRVRELAYKRFEGASKALGLSPADRVRIKSSLLPKEGDEGGPRAFDSEHGGGSA